MGTYDYAVVGSIFGALFSAVVCVCCWNAHKERKERRLAREYAHQIIADFKIDIENYNINKEKKLSVPQ